MSAATEHQTTIGNLRTTFAMLEAMADKMLELTPEAVTTGDDDIAEAAEINALRRGLAGVSGVAKVYLDPSQQLA